MLLDKCLRLPLLILARIEDDRAVFGSHVRALPIQGRRIVRCEEDREHIVISNLCWIVFDLGDLGVAGTSSAYLRVGWVCRRAARIARRHGNYALQSLEHRFSAPEAAPAKDCNFRSLIHGLKNNSMWGNENERRPRPAARFLCACR